MEKTYIMLKPETLHRCLMGKMITRIEEKGFKITAIKMFNMDRDVLDEHYSHIVNKPFYPEIVASFESGPVVGMIVEGDEVVEAMIRMIGPTNWREAKPGTIRGDYCFATSQTLIHRSDDAQTAEIEMKRFFN